MTNNVTMQKTFPAMEKELRDRLNASYDAYVNKTELKFLFSLLDMARKQAEESARAFTDQTNQMIDDLKEHKEQINYLTDFIRAMSSDKPWKGNLQQLLEESDKIAKE